MPFALSGARIGELAVAAAGMLLAHRALIRMANGLVSLTGAAVAWRWVAPLFEAAGRSASVGLVADSSPGGDAQPKSPLLEAQDLWFEHPRRPEPVLRGASLRVHHGDRILLQGNSGAGKSTFGAILAGLRRPSSGLLLS